MRRTSREMIKSRQNTVPSPSVWNYARNDKYREADQLTVDNGAAVPEGPFHLDEPDIISETVPKSAIPGT